VTFNLKVKIGGKIRVIFDLVKKGKILEVTFDLVKKGKVLEGMEKDKRRGRASLWIMI
jgi:hypothetical protein